MELKQGNMYVTDYVAKFEELTKFYPHYYGFGNEDSKCVMFESSCVLKSNRLLVIKRLAVFSVRVNKCKIYYKDTRARCTYYKSVISQNDK